jgi:hypothetical protein
MNSKGPNTVPCGTPPLMFPTSERQYQSGFMRGHSTVHQLIEIYHNMCLSLENREVMCTVFCDISKAFDKDWHRGLLKQLKAYGISGISEFNLCSISFILEDEYDSDVASSNNRERL